MTIQHLYPTTRPTLDLNFARQKRLDPRVTFTRGSTATYVGSDGLIKTAASNEARFDHDPTTGESLGLLVEEARTNLQTYSEDFSTWVGNSTTAAPNSGLAPDGTYTANLVQEKAETNLHYIQKPDASVTSGTTYTFSVFLKKGSGATAPDWVSLRFSGNGFVGGAAAFNLSTGVVGNTGNLISSGITEFPGGWYRCYITEAADETRNSGGLVAFINNQNTHGLPSYTGQTTSDVYAWGAQLEAGSFPTSYIPTSGSTVTRSADVASMTGTNFSSWYNQSEGSVFCDGISISNSNSTYWTIDNGSTTGATVLVYPTNTITFQVNSPPLQVSDGFFSGDVTTRIKTAAGLKADNFACVANGGSVVSDPSGALPGNVSVLRIGKYLGNVGFAYSGTISRLTYYPTRLTDSQLQALTL